ncbi:MAG: hydantoinase/oxoprolinase family protein [Acidimicrobiales bacterium]
MAVRLGVDVGGTFTDVVLEQPGSFTSIKVLTTHEAPEAAILDAIATVIERAGTSYGQLTNIIHGTTLATNALIERSGARAALVTTAGFRDVIETRTESRFEQYALDLVLPAPLIERRHRYVVNERMSADGKVLVEFDEAGARAVVDSLVEQDYEAVAIGFMHSYRDPTHEKRFRDMVTQRMPDISVSISAEVSPQMREFERFNTVCANAYVQPVISAYLHRLKDRLSERGATCPVHLIHSGGGLMSLESAARFPVRLIESGPAGGAIFAADIAERYGIDHVLSYDMGGTTAKICLIENHTPRTAKTFEVARTHRFTKGSGMPISIPVIEMIEIGAGGGSIAGVDRLSQIRVGPRSAGSEPGPAAYDLGGTEPTVAHADLLLGRLHPDTFGAETIDLSPDAARRAVSEGVAGPLGLDARRAAVGISEVVDENMANAARVHAVENGQDVSGATMIAFGGAAPLHAARLCDKLGINELIIPPDAGVGSAIGFLRAPFAYEAVRSYYALMDDFDYRAVNALLAELTREAQSFVREGTDVEPTVERWVYMRYAGQGWEIPVELAVGAFDTHGHEQLAMRFEKSYEEFFGRPIDGLAIEAVSWAVRVASPRRPAVPTERAETRRTVVGPFTRPLFDTALDAVVEASVIDRETLTPGDALEGPSIITEPQTTTILGSSDTAVMQPDGCLVVTIAKGRS